MTIIISKYVYSSILQFPQSLAVLMNLYLRISCYRQDTIINPHYTDRQTQAQKGQITQDLIAGTHKWQTGDLTPNPLPWHFVIFSLYYQAFLTNITLFGYMNL